jgi:cytochrome o ubiquinol oxidase operon protein cyoD
MSNHPHHSGGEPAREHGTIGSYVIGFILSLIFTLIPYFLVTRHTVSGNALLASILGFAMLQMVVQITFFLHLGRGPKPKWNLFFFLSTVGIILIVVGGSIMIINNLHYNMLPSDQIKKLANEEGIYQIDGKKTGACQGVHANHVVTIKNSQLSPLYTAAQKCDTLTFINEDKVIRQIAFGAHPHHDIYAGESELVIPKGKDKTITLSEPGTYQFHDHLHEEIAGNFTVSP